MTHDINADPEMWELREKFGDRAGFVWLECLSIADRNQGIIGPNCEQLLKTLASKCRLRAKKVRAILSFSCDKGWTKLELSEHLVGTKSPLSEHLVGTKSPLSEHLVGTKSPLSEHFRVAKWAKYHRTREPNKTPSEPSEPYLHNNTGHKETIPRQERLLVLPDWLNQKAWDEYRTYRKKIGHAMTKHAERLAINKLQVLKDNGENPTAVLEQSIFSGWRGLFEVKSGRGKPENQLNDRIDKILRRGL